MAKKVVNSFNAGELSPYLYAREDVDKYQSGCQELENFVPLPYGGVIRRPAIQELANTKDNINARLYPFTFNVDEAFMLEIGNTGTTEFDGYFRFYKDKQQIIENAQDLTDATKFKWTRGTVSGSLSKYYYCTLPDDSDPQLDNTTSLIIDGVTIYAEPTAKPNAPSFFIKDNDSLGFQTIYLKITNSGGADGQNPNTFTGTLTLGSPAFEVSHPYLADEIKDLKFTQSADVLFITHPNHPVKTLSRTSSADNTSWDFSDFDFSTGFPPLQEENTNKDFRITSSSTSGTTTLTSNLDLFDDNHVGAYFKFRAIRDKSNSSITANYASSNISNAVNVSNSNWNITTNGTWLGKVTLERSLDGGINFETYIIVGDTSGNGTTAGQSNAKNFATSSEQPEENNTFIRVRYDHVNSSASTPFNFSFVIENPYIESLVQISSVTSATEATANVISPFQDSIQDYTSWSSSQAFSVGTKVQVQSPFEFTTFNDGSSTIDLKDNTEIVVGGSEDSSHLTDLNNTVACASGKISISSIFGENATISASDVTQIAYDHNTEIATITTSSTHRIAKGMSVTFDGITSSTLPQLSGDHIITERTDTTNFKIALPNGGLSTTGNYDITNASLSLVNQQYFFVQTNPSKNTCRCFKFFISPEDDTVTLVKVANLGANDAQEDIIDIALANDLLYVIARPVIQDARYYRLVSFNARDLSYNVFYWQQNEARGSIGLRAYRMYPRSIGYDKASDSLYYAQVSHEYKTGKSSYNRNVNYIFRLGTNGALLGTDVFPNSSVSSPFMSDITSDDSNPFALDTHNHIISKRVSGAFLQTLQSFDVSGQSTSNTGLFFNATPETATLDNSLITCTTLGILRKYKPATETKYYECVKEIDSSTPTFANTFIEQYNDGHWRQLEPNMNKWSEGAFSKFRGFPSCLALYQNRMVFSGVSSYPDTIWLSRSDDYNNFLLGTLATSAMKLTINSGNLDSIQWLVPHEALIIGTSGSEWSLEPESDRTPINPTSFALNRKTTYGSNTTQATLINSAVIFAMRQGRKVREWTYDFNQDEFIAPDLTIFSEHITEGGITNWAYQQQPDNILWLIRQDGQLLGFTYEREQKVYGWHRHTVNDTGKFLSIGILPNSQEEDEVFSVTEYEINPPDWVSSGTYHLNQYVDYNDVCYICIQPHTGRTSVPSFDTEYWNVSQKKQRKVGVFREREFTDYTSNYIGVDFSIKFESPASSELTGLDEFEGKTVSVVKDGIPDTTTYTVNAGKIDIGTTGSTTVYVGLNYTACIAPMYLDTETTSTTTLGSKKDVQNATIRFKDTLQAKVGQTKNDLDSVVFNSDNTALYSEDAEVWLANASEFLKLIYVINDTPSPCSILAMIPRVEDRR